MSDISVNIEIDDEAKYEKCFYCFASLSKYNKENDHFPVPYDCGGTQTIPACVTCHDMKDRFPIDRWTIETWTELMVEFDKLRSRTLRILFAKVVCAAMRMEKTRKKELE